MYIYQNDKAILLRPESYSPNAKQATFYWGDITQFSANIPHRAKAWRWNGWLDNFKGTDNNVTYVEVYDVTRSKYGELHIGYKGELIIDFDREEVYESEGEFVDKRNGKSYVFIPWKEISGE
jgi:hypothetical protein